MGPSIIVVVYQQDAASVRSKIANMCRLGWERDVKVYIANTDADCEELTDDVIRDASYANIRAVFFQGDSLNLKQLRVAGISAKKSKSPKTLIERVKDALRSLRISWEENARAEWNKSSLQHVEPEIWLRQFSQIGLRDLGKNLLKTLKVFTHQDCRASFKQREADQIGLRSIHAYFYEDEAGSSSNAIKDILEHLHPEGTIRSLDMEDSSFFDKLSNETLFVYEDGLWSGVEVVRRLKKLSTIQSLLDSNVNLVFRYCVTADAGLVTARIAASRYEHRKFQIQSSQDGYNFKFLREGAEIEVLKLENNEDVHVRGFIDDAIEPYAFSFHELWEDKRDEALKSCAQIGAQLVKPYLERKAVEKAKKSSAPGAVISPKVVSEQDISQMALGAMGFASTVVFSTSIPKPVLPLMWLQGPISFNGNDVDWQPLFWDSRRTGEHPK